ncbi:MAG: flagellar biosynthesis regulator FlaF [Alphaproteobacteria bacterium]|nr:flagellar biosynthesis regulator FlaF [Alphaproteobacteria bacterium]
MSQDKVAAYSTHQRQDETVRETEAHALLSCASRLETARQPDCSKEFFTDALHHNQQLWTLFQACLCDPENPLPRDLKTLLLNLSCYVDKVTFRAMSERNTDLLSGLISINRTIAAGLRQKPEGQTEPATAAPVVPENTSPTSLMTSA